MKQNSNYKICIVYKGRVEKCMYSYANSFTHALNIGRLKIKQMYGMNSQHYCVVEKVK